MAMLTFGNIVLRVEHGSLSITTREVKEVRHYANTNQNKVISKGKMPVEVSCVLLAKNDAEKTNIEIALNTGLAANLYFPDKFYKKAESSGEVTGKPDIKYSGQWRYNAVFICPNPTPYDPDTGEALI